MKKILVTGNLGYIGTVLTEELKKKFFVVGYDSGFFKDCNLIDVEPLQNQIQHFSDCILKNDVCKTGTQHTKMVIKILEMD